MGIIDYTNKGIETMIGSIFSQGEIGALNTLPEDTKDLMIYHRLGAYAYQKMNKNGNDMNLVFTGYMLILEYNRQ
jgi:hypothetical protein